MHRLNLYAMFVREASVQRDINAFKKLYRDNYKIEKMPRKWQYTIGEDTQKCIYDMSLAFDCGWVSTNRLKKISLYEDAIGLLYHIEHNLNDMNDENVIDNHTKAVLDMAADKIGRQMQNLLNSLTNSQGGGIAESQTTARETHY